MSKSVLTDKPSLHARPTAVGVPKEQVDVVLLAGRVGLEDAWTGGLARAMLPLPGTTLIGDLCGKLRAAFEGSCSICVNGSTASYRKALASCDRAAAVQFVEDVMPRGTAGCLKACESNLTGELVFVSGASIWLEDDPQWMIEAHRASGNALTLFCIPQQVWAGDMSESRLRPSGLFVCDRAVLQYICDTGYQDIKEQLVPALQRAGLRIGAVALKNQTLQVADWPTYLHAVTRSLSGDEPARHGYREIAPAIWCGADVEIASDARVIGPALLGSGCRLEPGSVMVGPGILGSRCVVESGAWAVRTVVADGCQFAADTSTSDYFSPQSGIPGRIGTTRQPPVRGRLSPARMGTTAQSSAALVGTAAPWGVLACVFVWAFWANFADLWDVWNTNQDYSAGQIVPFAFLYMLISGRSALAGLTQRFAPAGVAVFALGLAMNLFGHYFLFASISNFGMVVCATGAVMAVGGMELYRRIWYPLAFLVLMVPLPRRIYDAVMLPLQGFGAQVSATFLEIIGVPVERFGHILEVAGQRVAVAEACSGLRMALAFLIVTALAAYVIKRPAWQRVVIVLSSVPIALGCNVVRIVGTAYLYSTGHDWLARGIFHDGAGLLMMPLALGLIGAELWVLSNLFAPEAGDDGALAARSEPAAASA